MRYIRYVWLSLRYVYMVCEVGGASYEEILTDVNEGGTRTPDFLEMNPQHTIPTLKAGSVHIEIVLQLRKNLKNTLIVSGGRICHEREQRHCRLHCGQV